MSVLERQAPSATASPTARPRRWLGPLAIGALGVVITALLSWQPSIWYDEAATISATTRSWPQLWSMLGTVDAVHGLYYGVMHLWFDLVGYTPFTLRLPSALATGAAAAATVLLVRRLSSGRVAVLAGLLLVLLPRITWAGAEGRSYAATALFAVALTTVFVSAWRSGRTRWWVSYGLFAALGTVFFAYLALIVAAHGVTAALTWLAERRGNATRPGHSSRSLGRWAIASASAAVLLLPFAAVVVAQSGQVSWIDPIGPTTLRGIFVTQLFYKNPLFAAVGWLLVALGAVLLALRSTRRSRARTTPPERWSPGPSLLAITLPWIVVPTMGLLVASMLVSPLYSPRYLTFVTPAAAALMAVAVAALRRRRLIAVVIAACLALALPHYLAQRAPEAKQESSWSDVAALVSAERANEPMSTPQAVIYGPVRRHASATTRVIAVSYPDAFDGLIDVKLKTPAAETGRLWETRYPLDAVTARLDDTAVVWLVPAPIRTGGRA
ncbi:glycosyltransferase family 39 protein [Lacisediminihabitans sp.]|uniref:glycosyltransferase family 39 protein n=1 Tax=Lacisediminihabitans sp. TaxID=2787631 RepID=UPI00374CF8E2